jgi:hypothetical protein
MDKLLHWRALAVPLAVVVALAPMWNLFMNLLFVHPAHIDGVPNELSPSMRGFLVALAAAAAVGGWWSAIAGVMGGPRHYILALGLTAWLLSCWWFLIG